jgi:hypothetical protein
VELKNSIEYERSFAEVAGYGDGCDRCKRLSDWRSEMADDLKNPGAQDRARISMGEEHEVRYWTKALGVTKKQLAAAVVPPSENARQRSNNISHSTRADVCAFGLVAPVTRNPQRRYNAIAGSLPDVIHTTSRADPRAFAQSMTFSTSPAPTPC